MYNLLKTFALAASLLFVGATYTNSAKAQCPNGQCSVAPQSQTGYEFYQSYRPYSVAPASPVYRPYFFAAPLAKTPPVRYNYDVRVRSRSFPAFPGLFGGGVQHYRLNIRESIR